jgi:hypothetical protein
MDLSNYDVRSASDSGVDVPLVVDGQKVIGDDGEPVTFRVRGATHHAVHAASIRVGRRPGKTPEEVIENDMRVVSAAVVGWSANFSVSGEKLSFSPDNLRKIMENPVVRRAIIQEIYTEANFMPKLSSD